MDLDGVWSDTLTDGTVQPGNGKYDTWTGNRDLEIWTCRLKANNLSSIGTEAALLNSYFSRSHAYRQGTASVGTTGLVYADDDWQSMASSDTSCLNSVFGSGDVTSVSAPEATTANDYKTNRLVTNYQLTMIRSHGSPGGHGFYQNSHGTYERVNNWEYPLIDPGIEFHSLYVCSGCDHSYSDYLAGIIVFNPQASGLVAWGSTKTGGMWQDSYYYNRLAAGEVFGEAFVYWFNYVRSHYPSYAPRWWYGMLLVGDATLRLFPEGVPPTPTASPTPSQTPTVSPTPSLPDIDLSVEGGMLDYGNLDLSGGPSNPQWITILNTGNAELHFTEAGFVIGGIDAGHFGFSATPDISPLIPAATRGVGIFFSPLSAGDKAAEVIVTSDDPDEPMVIVPLVGTAFLGIEDWMNY